MKIILSTDSVLDAMVLKNQILKSVKHEVPEVDIRTWDYIKSQEGYDIIYHNPQQYTSDPARNVLFRAEVDGSNLIFTTGRWTHNPEPSDELYCEHTGRLTEMLLRYFKNKFIKFSIVD